MKKILFYLPFIKVGGIEKVSISYFKILIEMGYQVELLVDFNMGRDGNTLEYAIPKEVSFQYVKPEHVSKFIYWLRTLGKKNKFFNIPLYGFMILFDFYYFNSKVKKIVKAGQYDWTISFYQFLPAYLTNIKSTKHIIWLHGSVEHFFQGVTKLFKNSYGKKLGKYDFVITIADEMKEQLEQFYPNLSKERIKRIYNPFNFEEILTKADDFTNISTDERDLLKDKYICTVSRLDEYQKDITTLIQAYKKLYYERKIDHKLYIIGDGPHRELLEKLVKKHMLDEQILFLGKKLNPYIWMKHADLFVLSSKYEGFGLVLVEAMTVETFVISSCCKTGPDEILQGGECGDLFEVGNYQELSNLIVYAINNYDYKSLKKSKAKNRILEFSKINTIQILRSLLSK